MTHYRSSRWLALMILACPTLALAGAWTQAQGQWQLITTSNLYQADYYFDANGHRQPQAAFIKQELSQYAEYGLRDGLTLGGQTSLARAFQNNASTIQNSGFNLGDTDLFARYRVWQNKEYVLSLQPVLTLPSPDSKTRRPKIGSDDYSFTLRGNVGRNFTLLGRSHYADASLGYAHRLGRAGDQIKLDLTAGLSLTDRWQVMPQAFITQATRNQQMTSFTQSASDDYDLAKLQLSVLYRITEKSSLQLGAYSNLHGKNTGNGHGALVAFWTQF